MGSIKLTINMRTFIIISLLIVITNAQFFGRFNSGGGRVNGGRGAGRFGGQRLFGGQGPFRSNSRPNRGQNRNPGNGGGRSNNQRCIGSSCNQINFNTGGGGISFGSGTNNNQGCTGGSNCNQINFG